MKLELHLNLPPRDCSPNRRGSSISHAKGIAEYRRETCYTAMSVKHRTCPNWQPCKVRISYTFLTHTTPLTKDRYRPQDLDNCRGSLKSAIDGLKDAHIIPDDTAEFVTWGDEALYVRESLSPKYIGKPRVILEIEERA